MFTMVAIFGNKWDVSLFFFSSKENWCGLVYLVASSQENLKKATDQMIFSFSQPRKVDLIF